MRRLFVLAALLFALPANAVPVLLEYATVNSASAGLEVDFTIWEPGTYIERSFFFPLQGSLAAPELEYEPVGVLNPAAEIHRMEYSSAPISLDFTVGSSSLPVHLGAYFARS